MHSIEEPSLNGSTRSNSTSNRGEILWYAVVLVQHPSSCRHPSQYLRFSLLFFFCRSFFETFAIHTATAVHAMSPSDDGGLDTVYTSIQNVQAQFRFVYSFVSAQQLFDLFFLRHAFPGICDGKRWQWVLSYPLPEKRLQYYNISSRNRPIQSFQTTQHRSYYF